MPEEEWVRHCVFHRTRKDKDVDELADLLESSDYDEESTTSDKYAEGLLKAHRQIVRRNMLLTRLLTNYIRTSKSRAEENAKLKRTLFYLFVAILVLLTIGITAIFFSVSFNVITTPLVVAIISAGVTYVGSLFTIYEIMFKYLFPADEEKDTISMIKTVVENDLKVEEFVSKLGDKKQ